MRLSRTLRPILASTLRSLPVRGRWRVAPLLNGMFPAEHAEASFPGVGRIRLDLADPDQCEAYWAGLHRDDSNIIRLMRTALPTDGVFVDVGANVGIHTLAAAKRVAAGGAVFAFEPHPTNYRALSDNVALNGWRHVTLENAGLAEASDVLTCHGPAGGNFSLASRGDFAFQVRLHRLDDYLHEHPVPRLDMIKIDVEGAEVRVLQGARETIERHRPLIAFEMCPSWLRRMNTSPAELLATFERFGYAVYRLPKGRRRQWGTRVTDASPFTDKNAPQWCNLVAVPPVRRPRPVVLTDVPGKPGRFWGDHTTCVGPTRPPAWLRKVAGDALAHDLTGSLAALRLFARRRAAGGVVTDGGASGILFAWLQAATPWGRKPHVMIDCNWYESSSRWRTWLKGLRLRLAANSVARFVVWASHEVQDYARSFGLPQEKLEYVPFHTTLSDYTYEIREGDYLFAGGNYDRDYPTLIEAVRDLGVPTWIATTRPEQMAGVELPPNVRVEGTTVSGFRQAMAAARLVVVPMAAGLLHSGGQQTALNAMSMGKPTIAVGRRWAADLIRDGEDGLIVDYADPEALRSAIRWVIDHPEQARRMGERARDRASWFTTERTMTTVYRLATCGE